MTLIPVSFVNDAQIRESKQVLTAANGTQIPVLGEVELSLEVGKSIIVFSQV